GHRPGQIRAGPGHHGTPDRGHGGGPHQRRRNERDPQSPRPRVPVRGRQRGQPHGPPAAGRGQRVPPGAGGDGAGPGGRHPGSGGGGGRTGRGRHGVFPHPPRRRGGTGRGRGGGRGGGAVIMDVRRHHVRQLDEELTVGTLPNGLEVFVLRKP